MESIVEQFYSAFDGLDAEKMVEFYHPKVVFEDPAFGRLEGERAKNMWRMLCASQKGKDFKIQFSNLKEDNKGGSANWEAFYTFSKTGRNVHNKIEATFVFKDGLIIQHIDKFDLHNWAKQAMGFKGMLLGASTFFKAGLQKKTNALLDAFEERKKP